MQRDSRNQEMESIGPYGQQNVNSKLGRNQKSAQVIEINNRVDCATIY